MDSLKLIKWLDAMTISNHPDFAHIFLKLQAARHQQNRVRFVPKAIYIKSELVLNSPTGNTF